MILPCLRTVDHIPNNSMSNTVTRLCLLSCSHLYYVHLPLASGFMQCYINKLDTCFTCFHATSNTIPLTRSLILNMPHWCSSNASFTIHLMTKYQLFTYLNTIWWNKWFHISLQPKSETPSFIYYEINIRITLMKIYRENLPIQHAFIRQNSVFWFYSRSEIEPN